ncbi:MAG: hypothetical protein AB7T37_12055 [Dehalococcoidia bacterium]
MSKHGPIPLVAVALVTAALQALVFALRPGVLSFLPVFAVAYVLALSGTRRLALYVACAVSATTVAVLAAAVFDDPQQHARIYVALVAALVFGLISTAMAIAAVGAGIVTTALRDRRRQR